MRELDSRAKGAHDRVLMSIVKVGPRWEIAFRRDSYVMKRNEKAEHQIKRTAVRS